VISDPVLVAAEGRRRLRLRASRDLTLDAPQRAIDRWRRRFWRLPRASAGQDVSRSSDQQRAQFDRGDLHRDQVAGAPAITAGKLSEGVAHAYCGLLYLRGGDRVRQLAAEHAVLARAELVFDGLGD
jgi:hypothetical protein